MISKIFGSAVTEENFFSANRGETISNIASLQKLTVDDGGNTKVVATPEAFLSALRDRTLPSICERANEGMKVNRVRVSSNGSDSQILAVMYDGAINATINTLIHDPVKYIDDNLGYLEIERKKIEMKESVLKLNQIRSVNLFKPSDILMHQAPSPQHLKDKSQQIFHEEVIYSAFAYEFALSLNSLIDNPKRDIVARHLMQAILEVGHVGGKSNHFYMELQPLNLILRATDKCVGNLPEFTHVTDYQSLLNTITDKTVNPTELYVGGPVFNRIMPTEAKQVLIDAGVNIFASAYDAMEAVSVKTFGKGLYGK